MKKIVVLLFSIITILCLLGCPQGTSGTPTEEQNMPTVDINKDGTVTITIQENQVGFIGCNGTLSNDSSKNSSNGYFYQSFPSSANNQDGGANIKYCVNTDTAGEYILTVHYAFGGYCDYLRDAYINVNGVRQAIEGNANSILEFPYTKKNWSVWNDVKCKINLVAGDNLISIDAADGFERQTVASDGSWANLDKLSNISNGDTIRGVVISLPNIDYISVSSTIPNVNMAAGSVNSSYWNCNVSSNNNEWGTVTITPEASSFLDKTEVTVTAIAKPGYKLSNISGLAGDSTWIGSNKTTYKFNITADTKLQARFVPENAEIFDGLLGYGTICDDNGTSYIITGGLGGNEIVINSLEDLTSYKSQLSSNDPYIVKIVGTITTTDNASIKFDIGSNKSIYGDLTNQGRLKNISFNVSGENIIIRNVRFGDVIADDYWKGTANDALGLNGAKHVWIDHCEFASSLYPVHNDGKEFDFTEKTLKDQTSIRPEGSESLETAWKKDFYDGALDIKNGAAFITISNCYFHDTWKACLCGSSDANENGDKRMRLTFYQNYWDGINSRQPMIRYGKAHIFSSYFKGDGSSTGINCRCESEVYIDNNYFEGIKTPIGSFNEDSKYWTGKWTNIDNVFSSCTNSVSTSSTQFRPPYEWTPITATEAKSSLQNAVGVGKLSAEDLQ